MKSSTPSIWPRTFRQLHPTPISLAQENQAHLGLLYVIENQKTGELVQPAELAESKLRKLRQLVWCEPRYLVEQEIPAEKILGSR